jgi:LuxR family maltose regulon positive regulatory protein
VDTDVRDAVRKGRRAVTVARAGSDDVLVSAFAGYARALYLAGDSDQAWTMAMRAIEQPEAERHGPSHTFARSTLALAAVDQGRLESARTHAEKAKEIMGGAGGSRSWPGANASAALGCALLAEGNLADAERELGHAQRFFSDEVATVHHTWSLALLARVRCRRGRLDDARATLELAREALVELADGGRVTALVDDVQSELERATAQAGGGHTLEPPSHAELAVLELLASDLSTRQIGAQLFLSPNTVRSHTRALYRKLGVSSRADAVARANAAGLLAGLSRTDTDPVQLSRSG